MKGEVESYRQAPSVFEENLYRTGRALTFKCDGDVLSYSYGSTRSFLDVGTQAIVKNRQYFDRVRSVFRFASGNKLDFSFVREDSAMGQEVASLSKEYFREVE